MITRYLTLALLGLTLLGSTFAAAADRATDPARILVLIERGFNSQEFYIPVERFREVGHEVVVASTEAGHVPLKRDGEPHKLDTTADVAMSDVTDISAYDALFIPGGFSPGYLEDDPDALRLVRAFMQRNQPVGAICHGPRLLMAADLMRDRVATMLYQVPSEKPDWWREGRGGSYVDQEVVVDGNLVTARYPRDAARLAETFLALLDASRSDATTTDDASVAWLALWPGFDEAVALALRPQLEAQGYTVRVAGPEKGWVRGLHGHPLAVDATYDEIDTAAWVIAPGGLWPKPGPARQGEQAAWVEAQAPQLEARQQFVRNSWQEGGHVLLAGFDSYLLQGWEPLKDTNVAASPQLRWSFKGDGPRFADGAVIATAPRLWTTSGAPALPAILRDVLPAWDPTPASD